MFMFNPELAVKYGVNESIILQNFIFWIKKNMANNTNYQDGKYWTYCSVQAMTKLFPFWSEGQVVRILKSLINQGILEKGCFNDNKYNRTSWYTITDNSIIDFQKMDLLKSTNGDVENDKSIKDNNKDKKNNIYEKEFEAFWKIYPKQRAGNKQNAYKAFIQAIKENRCTVDRLLESVKCYAASEAVKSGYAKGCAAWLHDDRFNDQYKEPKPRRKKFVVEYDLNEINKEITPEDVIIPAAYVGVK